MQRLHSLAAPTTHDKRVVPRRAVTARNNGHVDGAVSVSFIISIQIPADLLLRIVNVHVSSCVPECTGGIRECGAEYAGREEPLPRLPHVVNAIAIYNALSARHKY